MTRKAQTMFTSKMMNKAAHEERKAARRARHQARAFESFARNNANTDVCYVSINGVQMPTSRA